MSVTTPNPKTAAARQAERDHLLALHIERGRKEGIRAHRSIKCGDYGRHAGSEDGCRSDGSYCLCECHDPDGPS